MDNTNAQLRLVLPKIPKSWCPAGALIADKFQSYQDTFLANAYLEIPGITTLDLLDIDNLQTEITNLQQQYNALNKANRTVLVSTVTNGTVQVSIVPNMPSDDYTVSLTILSPAGASPVTQFYAVSLVSGSKDVNGCSILCSNMPANYQVECKFVQN